MLIKDPPSVFPLYLAPIDYLYCLDDRPEYPMTSVIHLDFEGEIDAARFDVALADAVKRHPLFRAFVKTAKQNKAPTTRSNARTANRLSSAMKWDYGSGFGRVAVDLG